MLGNIKAFRRERL